MGKAVIPVPPVCRTTPLPIPQHPPCPRHSPKGSLDQSRALDNKQAHASLWGHRQGWGAGDTPVGLGDVSAFPHSLQGGRSPTELWAHRTQQQHTLAPGTRPQSHSDGLAPHPPQLWGPCVQGQPGPCPPPVCPPCVLYPCSGKLSEGREGG